jgi:hypothetical protein
VWDGIRGGFDASIFDEDVALIDGMWEMLSMGLGELALAHAADSVRCGNRSTSVVYSIFGLFFFWNTDTLVGLH